LLPFLPGLLVKTFLAQWQVPETVCTPKNLETYLKEWATYDRTENIENFLRGNTSQDSEESMKFQLTAFQLLLRFLTIAEEIPDAVQSYCQATEDVSVHSEQPFERFSDPKFLRSLAQNISNIKDVESKTHRINAFKLLVPKVVNFYLSRLQLQCKLCGNMGMFDMFLEQWHCSERKSEFEKEMESSLKTLENFIMSKLISTATNGALLQDVKEEKEAKEKKDAQPVKVTTVIINQRNSNNYKQIVAHLLQFSLVVLILSIIYYIHFSGACNPHHFLNASKKCQPKTKCDFNSSYEKKPPTEESDRECALITQHCGLDEYEESGPTLTQDRVCTKITKTEVDTLSDLLKTGSFKQLEKILEERKGRNSFNISAQKVMQLMPEILQQKTSKNNGKDPEVLDFVSKYLDIPKIIKYEFHSFLLSEPSKKNFYILFDKVVSFYAPKEILNINATLYDDLELNVEKIKAQHKILEGTWTQMSEISEKIDHFGDHNAPRESFPRFPLIQQWTETACRKRLQKKYLIFDPKNDIGGEVRENHYESLFTSLKNTHDLCAMDFLVTTQLEFPWRQISQEIKAVHDRCMDIIKSPVITDVMKTTFRHDFENLRIISKYASDPYLHFLKLVKIDHLIEEFKKQVSTTVNDFKDASRANTDSLATSHIIRLYHLHLLLDDQNVATTIVEVVQVENFQVCTILTRDDTTFDTRVLHLPGLCENPIRKLQIPLKEVFDNLFTDPPSDPQVFSETKPVNWFFGSSTKHAINISQWELVKKYNEILQPVFNVKTKEELKQAVEKIVKSAKEYEKSNNCLKSSFQNQIRLDKSCLPTLFAHTNAVWGLSHLKLVGTPGFQNELKTMRRLHNAQIVAILMALGVHLSSDSVPSHMLQILTGEGKSVILAHIAIVMGLIGVRTKIVAYSKYLTQRDQNDFAALFITFGMSKWKFMCF
jgi:hypothetical protein